jgi:DNA-binding CsgD family transcriptional regulator
VWRAAEQLRIPESAALEAQSGGLVTFGDGFTFRHPLVRSAVYRSARATERSKVHRALAAATDLDKDPDRRAWHLAQAAVAPDEDVAADLERSAARAHARGGLAAEAAFLERSAVLTLDRARRAARTLAAATTQQQAGALDEALALLDSAESGPLDEHQRAQANLLRARISFATDRGRDAPALLVAAASRLGPLDAYLARETYLDALSAAVFAGRLAGACDARAVADRALAAPPAPSPPRAVDLLLDGLALLINEGPAVGTPIVSQAVGEFRGGELASSRGVPWLWLSGRAAGYIWDYEGWDSLTLHQLRVAREAGALGDIPLALSTRVGVEIFGGDVRAAEALEEQSKALASAIDGRTTPRYGPLAVAAFRGREAEVTTLVRTSIDEFNARGEGLGISLANWVMAVLGNSLGRYEAAFDAAVAATVNPRELWFSTFATVELIEAATRSGHAERAANALEVLSASTRASGSPWALGVEARSRALVSRGDTAESLYHEAVERLTPTRLRLDLARTHLLFGEWLRREGRRLKARRQLRLAHDIFSGSGMEAFAERARAELEATGEHARKRTVDTIEQLTPQEAEVARLAALGSSNREIAAQLFISPKTVEYHLGKAFRKLDATSRTQLARRLP